MSRRKPKVAEILADGWGFARPSDVPPSDRQLEILRLVAGLTRRAGYPPTVRELMDELDIKSTNGVADHLRALARRGLVEWRPNQARTLRLTDGGRRLAARGSA